jgi:hypothetical protein
MNTIEEVRKQKKFLSLKTRTNTKITNIPTE